ncbi:MAG: spermidine synthase [Gemmatimonadales bacterium]
MIRALYLLFVLSGAAGLIYESIWTRYLGLFVGHDAYAQIIVLVIFLGGMSAGALAVSRKSERLIQPLYGYVGVEFAVGVIGLYFHDIFQAVTSWAYATVYPELAGSWLLPVAKWGIASALILPQSVLLGMTFPLMSAAVLRLARGNPGRSLSMLYFSNSLGAAAGVLIAGFYLVALAGLPGTLLAAAMLNLVVAGSTVGVIVAARNAEVTGPLQGALPAGGNDPEPATRDLRLQRLLLWTSLGTAVASFIYEIDWIRMLALVLGSATHSFELMLSAFILGLALGAFWIRSRADRFAQPLRTLGIVQWTMGFLALATLPLYVQSFEWVAALLSTFARNDAGYAGFTIARYGLCLLIMLPATFCAGMTLPLITRTLIVRGAGERAIGAVYAWNTLGSIIGVVLGGLVLLPLIGLKAMLITGAAIDMAIGAALLARAAKAEGRGRRLAPAAALAAVALTVAVGLGLRLDQNVLASGVYRTGHLIPGGDRSMIFYRDGRTSTVTGFRTVKANILSLATNGKPDASLTPIWYQRCDSFSPPAPLMSDAATQTLLPLVTLAHVPGARTAAVIGQGSGMSSHLLLGSAALESLVTIEIEPQMIEGSRIFAPANRRAFEDPRSEIVIDDAKSYFASAHRRFDLIMSEPSNPWVSGVSGLFTTEFYGRVRQYLTDDGVFGQWLHVYELDDPLVLSVLAAIHQNFHSYEIYLVPSGDLLIVASNRDRLPAPDWSVFQAPGLHSDLCHFPPLTPSVLDALSIAGRQELAPLLDSYSQPNSDYYPVLDLGAEQRRFRGDRATGFSALSDEWFNLLSSMTGRRSASGGEPLPALPENPRVRALALGALVRSPAANASPDSLLVALAHQAIYQSTMWQAMLAADHRPSNWELWLEQANGVDRLRNGGTAGTANEAFYTELAAFMNRHNAPQPVRDVVTFRHAIAAWNFAEAAAAADRLLPVVLQEHRWISPDELRDGLVFARLHLRDATGARQALDTLAQFSARPAGDLRSMLLGAYVRTLEAMPATATQPLGATPATP